MNRLDEIFGDCGGESLAALPVEDHETIRQAIRHSISVSGIHATAEHWARIMDTIGQVPQAYLDSVKLIFNQEVAECF